MNKHFWINKKVLITGHTGFKGSRLSLWLQTLGTKVIGYSLPPPTKPSLFEVAHVERDMTSVIGDIRDLDKLRSTIAKHQPEIIFHMAAQSLVRYSYDNPVETYSTNVIGTVNVLESVRQIAEPRVVIVVTSDKCYKNNEWVWGYRENEPMGGVDPYSSSKGCAELITDAYRNSYFAEENYSCHGVAVASVRAGNVIGGGDWAKDRLISDIMKAITENRPAVIRNPRAIRPWQYILDPLNGYLTLAERLWESGPKFAGGWNFGPNSEDAKPVHWIADRLTKLWGKNACWKMDSAQNPHEAHYLKLDCSKAKSLLGWSPKLDLATTLKWIVQWYRAYLQKKNMRQVTEAEISRYENMLQK